MGYTESEKEFLRRRNTLMQQDAQREAYAKAQIQARLGEVRAAYGLDTPTEVLATRYYDYDTAYKAGREQGFYHGVRCTTAVFCLLIATVAFVYIAFA